MVFSWILLRIQITAHERVNRNYKYYQESGTAICNPRIFHRRSDIVKKTYAKLREVTITYNVLKKFLGNNGVIRSASISLVGRNLLYFSG
jgi:hypothetical protein